MGGAFDIELPDTMLAGARRGERGAQERIYRAFEKPVYNLVRRMVGDPDAALDVMQDAFLRAFDRLHQFRGEAPFGAWLRSVAASEALMHLRRGRYWSELFTTDDDAMAGVGVEDASDADLERLLAQLPPLPRSVLWLYHVEGYTHPEIARLCGKTASFSKSQLSRAHRKLRTLTGANNATANEPCSAELAKTI